LPVIPLIDYIAVAITENNIIELHAPTSSTQKLKLIGKGGQFTYTPTLPLTCRLPQAAYVEYWSGL
jgi:hypothetical protein